MKPIYFTPGPTELYYTVDFHVKNALKAGIGSINHRSKEFESIYSKLNNDLKLLLNIPDEFSIFFTSSATEVWERIGQNLIAAESFHFCNGAFAKKFADIIELQNKKVHKHLVDDGKDLSPDKVKIPPSVELISITQNETSTGVRFPLEDIEAIRKKYPDSLIAIDAVSSIPCEHFNFDHFDTIYFSVQKCFGLPAGLGVWILNDRCIEKATQMESENQLVHSSHSVPQYLKNFKKLQTPSTPNVLNIYLLSKVIEDMLEKGIDQIRREIDYKSALLYHTINQHDLLQPFVKQHNIQSKTVVVGEIESSQKLLGQMEQKGYKVGDGYGIHKGNHIRIANFPAHSKESIERLVDEINQYN